MNLPVLLTPTHESRVQGRLLPAAGRRVEAVAVMLMATNKAIAELARDGSTFQSAELIKPLFTDMLPPASPAPPAGRTG